MLIRELNFIDLTIVLNRFLLFIDLSNNSRVKFLRVIELLER